MTIRRMTYSAVCFNFSVVLSCIGVGCNAPSLNGDPDVWVAFDDLSFLVETLTVDVLDANDRKALQEALDAAEAAYQDENPCSASVELKTFMGLAQDFRSGEAEGITEDMYNLGRMLRHSMVVGVGCQGDERVGVIAETTFGDNDSDNTHLDAVATFGELTVFTVEESGETFTHIQVPGADTDMGEPGEFGLPVFRKLVAVPRGATLDLQYTTTEAETIYLNLYPSQPQPVDQAFPEPDPQIFETLPFTQDTALYQSDAFYPEEAVRITELGQCRDLRMVMLEITAGRYNPVTDALVLFDEVDFQLKFNADNKQINAFITEDSLSPFESNSGLYIGAVLNAGAVTDYVESTFRLRTIDGEELLILTHPDFFDAANTLAQWKNQKGIVTHVIQVMDGAGPGPDTKEEIDDLIKFRYDEGFIRPSYVLLMGDAEFIPVFYVNKLYNTGVKIGTDWPYSIYGPYSTDRLPDFAVGRIPVDTDEEAATVVAKIIGYEKTPPNDASFYTTATLAAQFQCCRPGAIYGTAERTFTEISEFVRNVMIAQGYTVQRIYEKSGLDQFPMRYYDGELLPEDLRPASGFAWDGDTEDITNAFNEGRFLIMHRDHGWSSGWSHPYFDTDNLNDTVSNGDLLPVVFSVNCASGHFDHETSIPTSPLESFAEELLLKEDGGAVGVLGDTRNSPSWENSALTLGFFDAIWPEAAPEFGDWTSKRRLGDILNHGKMYLLTQSTMGSSFLGRTLSAGATRNELSLWHVIGDPTLELWTQQPDRVVLAPIASAVINGDILEVAYATEGALITAFQRDAESNPVPVGRAEVVGGAAHIELISALDELAGIELAMTLENALSASVEVDAFSPNNVVLFEAMPLDGHVELSWNTPTTADYAGVRIQRSIVGFPSNPYLGDTVYDGSGRSYDDTVVTNGQIYYYVAFAYDEVPNFASGQPASATPQVPAPSSDVFGFDAIAGETEVALSWVNPVDEILVGVRIQRRTDAFPTAYDDGTTVYDDDGTSFTDIELTNDVTYYYTAFTHNLHLLYSAGVEASAMPRDSSPPAYPSYVEGVAGDGYVNLLWTNPEDADLAGVRIQRGEADWPLGPDDGTNVFDGTGETHTDNTVVNDTTYRYSFFAYDTSGNFSGRRPASAVTPYDMTPPGPVTGLSAQAGNESVLLRWTNPTDADFQYIRIVRSETAFPATPSDPTTVGTTVNDKFTDTDSLSNKVQYYYSLFARDTRGNYSTATQITATPEEP